MRWFIVVFPAVLCTGAALWVSLFLASNSALSERGWDEGAGKAQYSEEDNSYVEPPQGATPGPSEVESPEADYDAGSAPGLALEGDVSEPGGSPSVSEGSAPGATAPAEALSLLEPPTPYSQVVDNATPGRFSERGWEEGAGNKAHYYGKDYSYVQPSKDTAPARFRVELPATDYYTVYARWPAAKGNNAAARFGVSTASGIEWIKANQRRDGGIWVRLGAYQMEAGNRYAVRVSGYSKAEGRVVADAVMVVRGTQVVPPEEDGVMAAGGQARGQDVVRRARNHIGTPYVHSPPGTCQAHRSEDCSCLTRMVFGKWLDLADDPVEQWKYGREVDKSNLRPGDLVFFKEAGRSNPITHVAIYSGGDSIIHASAYWGEVVERPMDYVSGYYGAKRLGRS